MADLKARLAQLRSQQASSSGSSSNPIIQSSQQSSSSPAAFIDPLAPADADSILESRLRALNPSSATLKSDIKTQRPFLKTGDDNQRNTQTLDSLLGSNFLQDFKLDQDRDQDSEVQDLLKSTSEQVEIERTQQTPSSLGSGYNPGEKLFGKVEEFSDDSESSDESDIEDGLSSPSSNKKKKTFSFNYAEESEKLKREAKEMVTNAKEITSTPSPSENLPTKDGTNLSNKDLKQEETIEISDPGKGADTRSLLVVEPKERPTLSRSSSLVALEDELANAMSEDLEPLNPHQGSSVLPSNSRPSRVELKSEAEPSGDSDLASRFARLHSNLSSTKGKGKEKAASGDSFLNLPSVPSSSPSPPDSPSSTKVSTSNAHIESTFDQNIDDSESDPFNLLPSAPTSDPTPGPSTQSHQDLDGVDLTPFSKLVRLNANELSDPGSFAAASTAKKTKSQKDQEADDEEVENWCCICNEDASLKCEGCDLDPYCSQCWAQGHSSMSRSEIREHRTLELHDRRKGSRKGKKSGGGEGGRKLMAA